MKKILLLGGSAQQIVAIKTAQKHGYYTVLCDFLPDNPPFFPEIPDHVVHLHPPEPPYHIRDPPHIDIPSELLLRSQD